MNNDSHSRARCALAFLAIALSPNDPGPAQIAAVMDLLRDQGSIDPGPLGRVLRDLRDTSADELLVDGLVSVVRALLTVLEGVTGVHQEITLHRLGTYFA